jgi:hypothetical protein
LISSLTFQAVATQLSHLSSERENTSTESPTILHHLKNVKIGLGSEAKPVPKALRSTWSTWNSNKTNEHQIKN